MHSPSGVRTFTQGDEVVSWTSEVAVRDAVTPWSNGVEDSAVTAPFVRALEVEGPTTIFDRSPELVTDRSFERAVTEDELEDSYEAALRKFV